MENYVKEECERDKNKFPQTIKDWMQNSNMFKVETLRKYSVIPLAPIFFYVSSMLCHLYDKPNYSIFLKVSVHLIENACRNYVFDWEKMYHNMATHIMHFHSKNTIEYVPPFYMPSYIMNVISFSLDFPCIGLKWTLANPLPINIYHSIL